MSDRGSITSYTHHAAQNRLYHNFILYLLRVDRILQSTATTNYEYISPKLFPLTLRLCLRGPCCGAAAWAESEALLPGSHVQRTRRRVLERLDGAPNVSNLTEEYVQGRDDSVSVLLG